MATKIYSFADYATRAYEPTKHETRMLLNHISGDTRFKKVVNPETWKDVLEYIKTADNAVVTKEAFRLIWLAYGAYRRKMES